MMRFLMAAVFSAVLSLSMVSAPVSAATNKDEQQTILLKKKKLAQAAKLKAQKIEQAKAKQDAFKKLQAQKLAVEERKTQLASGKKCKFLECLFGKRQPRVTRNGFFQNASFGSQSGVSTASKRKTIEWTETKYPVGSIIIRTPERALYYVKGDGEAIRYAVGVGREGMQWSGNSTIVAKAEWPSWTPPQTMIEREAAKGHFIPDFMEGGPGNPLGARAMYIGGKLYRVHGTNNESSIGGAVSSGCIRMMNADVIDLYDRVKIGAKIYVYQ